MTDGQVQAASQQYFARIRRAALIIVGNPWDADDLAQETFLVLARNGDRFEGRSNLYTWLYGVLLNLARRHYRTSGVRRRKLQVLWQEEPRRPAPAADAALEMAEWRSSLWALVAQLPPPQRDVLVLRFSEHLAYHEIAEALNCPLGTVKSRIFNGLAALRAMTLPADGSGASHSVLSFPAPARQAGS